MAKAGQKGVFTKESQNRYFLNFNGRTFVYIAFAQRNLSGLGHIGVVRN
jgi:hypothetical protein